MEDARHLDLMDVDGNHTVREVLTIVFYIRKPHLAVGLQVEAAIHRFTKLVSYELLPFFADSEGEWQDLSERALPERLADEYGIFAGAVNATVVLRGAGRYPADFYLRYGGDLRAGEQGFASYFQCWVPTEYWVGRRNELLEYADELASTLPFGFGYVSLAAVSDDRRRIQKLAKRYIAIDIASPGALALDIGDLAGGSYWVTYLGQVLCESVGGAAGLRRELPSGIAVQELADGKCRLQLGPEPISGDVNHRQDVSLYRALSAYFESRGVLHVPERVVYFQDDRGLTDRDAQEEWHRRFLGEAK